MVQGVILLLTFVIDCLKNCSNLISSPKLEGALRKGLLWRNTLDSSEGITRIFQPVFDNPHSSPLDLFALDTHFQRYYCNDFFISIPVTLWLKLASETGQYAKCKILASLGDCLLAMLPFSQFPFRLFVVQYFPGTGSAQGYHVILGKPDPHPAAHLAQCHLVVPLSYYSRTTKAVGGKSLSNEWKWKHPGLTA